MDRFDRPAVASPECRVRYRWALAPALPPWRARRTDPHARAPLGDRRRHSVDPDHPVGCVPDHHPRAPRVPTIPADARLLPTPLDALEGRDQEDAPGRPAGEHPHGVRTALAALADGALGIRPDLLVRAPALGLRIPDR